MSGSLCIQRGGAAPRNMYIKSVDLLDASVVRVVVERGPCPAHVLKSRAASEPGAPLDCTLTCVCGAFLLHVR